MNQELTLEQFAQQDYPSFVKQLMMMEMDVSPEQADILYEEYIDNDDLTLINPAFSDLLNDLEKYRIEQEREEASKGLDL
ncbi:hypothetical protein [Streptococcus sp. E17BB]|uniref:hypothetical protein n=1 Tax=Streptococcus sp. E17BB TaxID=3278714 RepID=UPI00359EA715